MGSIGEAITVENLIFASVDHGFMTSFSSIFQYFHDITVTRTVFLPIRTNPVPLLLTRSGSAMDTYQDPFADQENLRLLWPHDLAVEVHRLCAIALTASYKISGPAKGNSGNVHLESEIDNGGMRLLAKFPHKYTAGLTVIIRKWDYYSRLYITAAAQDLSKHPDKVEWKADLLESWGRHLLFIERVLEAAIQWSRGDRGSTCHVLRLFLAQERMSTVHAPSITGNYRIAQNDENALLYSTPLAVPSPPPLRALMPITRTAIQHWQKDDRTSGARLWLTNVSDAEVAAQAKYLLLKAERPPAMQVSPLIPLGHMIAIV